MRELIIDQVIKMWRKGGKTWISAIAIAVLFMAMTFVPGVSAKENLETSVVTVERAADADFTMLAKVFARAAYILDNVASLPDMAYDFTEAIFAVTLSEDAITALFTTVIAVVELIIGWFIFGIPVYFLVDIPAVIIGMIVVFLSAFLPPIIGLIWGFPACILIVWVGLLISLLISLLIAIIPVEMLDNAIGLSGLIGGVLSRIYFALTLLWKILYKFIGPIIRLLRKINPIINKGIDAALGLLGEPIADFGDRFLKEVY